MTDKNNVAEAYVKLGEAMGILTDDLQQMRKFAAEVDTADLLSQLIKLAQCLMWFAEDRAKEGNDGV